MRRGALIFILITIGLDAVGLGILIPVTPTLIAELSGEGLARAAIYGGWLTALFAIVQFVAGPILGSLSDQFGRRPVLLRSLAAFGLSYLLMGFAPSLAWLFVAQCLTGLFGATPSTAAAFIADITPPEQRARYFGSTGAAFGVGLIIGPVLGGLLVEHGTRVPFFAAAGLSLLNVLYGFLVLPESLKAENRRPFSFRRSHPIGAFQELRRYAGIPRLLCAVLLMQITMQTLPTIWPYYTMQKLGWTAREVGYSLGVYGLANIIVQALITGRVSARLGDARAARAGFILFALGYLGFAFSNQSAVLIACIPITVLGFTTGPALTSLMSGRIDAGAQGKLLGLIASATSAAAILTPLLMPRVFSLFSTPGAHPYFPGAPYVLGAFCALLGVFLIRHSVPLAHGAATVHR
jgi:DHA1 family tetracycline resistance protein-like MFS transporter